MNSGPAPPIPSDSAITSNPSVMGIASSTVSLSADGTTYSITVPAGTDVKNLKVSIPITSGSKIAPDPGVARDYTSPVAYTITKTDGSKQPVTVKVIVQNSQKSAQKTILSFTFAAFNPEVQATIDQTTRKITATVPAGADLTKLLPTFTVSAKASVTPASGLTQDFTNLVKYTVTAEDGSKQDYDVKVEKATPLNDRLYFAQGKMIYCLDANTGVLIWAVNNDSVHYLSNPAYGDGLIFFGGTNTLILRAVNALNGDFGGEVITQTDNIDDTQNPSSPAVGNGSVYIGSARKFGKLFARKTTTYLTGGMIKKWEANSPAWSAVSPILGGDIVYLGPEAYDVETGLLKWKIDIGIGGPTILNGKLYAGVNHGNIEIGNLSGFYCFDAAKGSKLWEFKRSGIGFLTEPTIEDGILYCVGTTGYNGSNQLFALDANTGEKKWEFSVRGPSSPLVYKGILYLFNENKLYALNAKTGKDLWAVAMGMYNSPVIANGLLYLPSQGEFQAIDPATGVQKWSFKYLQRAGDNATSPCIVMKDGQSYNWSNSRVR